MNKERILDRERTIEALNHELLNCTSSTQDAPDPSIPYLKYDQNFGIAGKLIFHTPAQLITVATSIATTRNTASNFWVTLNESYLGEAGSSNYAAVARITAQGVMDLGFGPDNTGFAQVKFDEEYRTYLQSTYEMPDGKLLVFGDSVERKGASTTRKPMITKLLNSGNQDQSFGNKGVVDVNQALEMKAGYTYYAVNTVDQPGSIYVVMQIPTQEYSESFLARFTTEGVLDQSFHNNGMARINRDGQPAHALGILIDNTTKRLIITCMDPVGSYLACYTFDGKADKEFGEAGFVDLSDHFDVVANCSLSQKNSHLFVTGNKVIREESLQAVLASYTPNGIPDPNFNNGKPAHSEFGRGFPYRYWFRAYSPVSEPHAVTVLGVYTKSNVDTYTVVGRYSKNGTPDDTFIEGKAIGQISTENYFDYGAQNFVYDTSSRYLVAGRSLDEAAIFAIQNTPE